MKIKRITEQLTNRIDKALLIIYVQGYARNLGNNKNVPDEQIIWENCERNLLDFGRLFPEADISFSWRMDMGSNHLNGMSIPVKKKIYINAKWAAVLCYDEDERVLDAFKMTLAHEYMHLKYDVDSIPKRFRRGAEQVLFNYLTEIRADILARDYCSMNLQQADRAFAYKQDRKAVKPHKSKTHPTLEMRREYLSYSAFDDKLIEKVAADLGIHDSAVICDAKKYFL